MIAPYYEDEYVTVYNVDCVPFLTTLPDGYFDLLVTDPPYGRDGEDFKVTREVIQECSRLTRMQVVVLDWRNPLTVRDGKFAEIVWEYGWISGGRTKSSHFYPTHNTIHFLGEDNFTFETKIGSILKRRPGFSSPRQCSYAKKTGHPFEKPRELMRYLINRSSPSDLVVDPFMGSGTTLVAAKTLGKRAVGVEVSREYCDMAVDRLRGTEVEGE